MSAEHLLKAIILMSPAHEVEHQIKGLYNLLQVNIQSKTTKHIPHQILKKKFYRQIFMLK